MMPLQTPQEAFTHIGHPPPPPSQLMGRVHIKAPSGGSSNSAGSGFTSGSASGYSQSMESGSSALTQPNFASAMPQAQKIHTTVHRRSGWVQVKDEGIMSFRWLKKFMVLSETSLELYKKRGEIRALGQDPAPPHIGMLQEPDPVSLHRNRPQKQVDIRRCEV